VNSVAAATVGLTILLVTGAWDSIFCFCCCLEGQVAGKVHVLGANSCDSSSVVRARGFGSKKCASITVSLWIAGAALGVNSVAAATVGLTILLVTGAWQDRWLLASYCCSCDYRVIEKAWLLAKCMWLVWTVAAAACMWLSALLRPGMQQPVVERGECRDV
jgi:hypothetical protein